MQPATARVKAGRRKRQACKLRCKDRPAPMKSRSALLRSMAVVMQNGSAPLKSATAVMKSGSAAMQSRSAPMQSRSGPMHSRSAPVKSRSAPMRSMSAPVQDRPVALKYGQLPSAPLAKQRNPPIVTSVDFFRQRKIPNLRDLISLFLRRHPLSARFVPSSTTHSPGFASSVTWRSTDRSAREGCGANPATQAAERSLRDANRHAICTDRVRCSRCKTAKALHGGVVPPSLNRIGVGTFVVLSRLCVRVATEPRTTCRRSPSQPWWRKWHSVH